MSKQTSDDFDNDHTDELPVLLETVTFEDERDARSRQTRPDDTAERTASYQTVEHGSATALQTEAAQRESRLAELEAQRAALARRRDDLEGQVADKDALIGELQRLIATLRDSANGPGATEQRLASELDAAEARIVGLTASVERLERDAAERATLVERLRTDAESAQREAEALKGELAERPAANEPTPDMQALLEENATLTAYIAARRAWWEDAQAERIGLEAKVAALQHELSVSSKRLEDAEAFAARESSRAVGLRSELVDAARRVSALERELRDLRAADATATSVDVEPSESQRTAEAGEPARREPTPDNGTAPRAEQELPVGMDSIGSAAPAVEAVAQLEAEVEYKRQQVAAQLVELRDRDQLLRAATGDIERVRRELASARNELEEARSAAARLEHAVIDKDRALQARDARIDTLQDEVKRLNAADKLGAPEARLEAPATRAAAIEPSAETPTLLCLTGDAPKRFVLTKKAVVIGRGPHCDVQILTHFVSREHARITLNEGRAVIEDAGSRNGVFVNAVRVDRQMLQHGDLITIGDTQFRFVESMAH